jgi:hypothetical protein
MAFRRRDGREAGKLLRRCPVGGVGGGDVGSAVSGWSGGGGCDPGVSEAERVLEGMAGRHGDADASD